MNTYPSQQDNDFDQKYRADLTETYSRGGSSGDSDHINNEKEHDDQVATGHKFFSKYTLLNYFPRYKLKRSGMDRHTKPCKLNCLALFLHKGKLIGIIFIDERPPVFQCLLMGVQHVLAMFGSTVLGIIYSFVEIHHRLTNCFFLTAPLLMGFDTNSMSKIIIIFDLKRSNN